MAIGAKAKQQSRSTLSFLRKSAVRAVISTIEKATDTGRLQHMDYSLSS
jgi:hypothetical protein